ncbi:MAG: hypothetical protein LH472_07195 [Pyrinomonadaceae bacterium]|nr:hypothetical protein [Pyrinomonadaceae bacterium]
MKTTLLNLVLFLMAAFILITSVNAVFSQTIKPELSVAGFRLGDEETAKTTLQSYSPRYDNELKQPRYFFYNEYGTQVMAITAYSKERPFLVVGIEVFAVGESYRNKHYQMKGVNFFVSESGFFIGEKPSATSLIFAIPNVTGAKNVIKKLGTPEGDERLKKARTLRYRLTEVKELETREAQNKTVNFGAFTAQYRFVKNRLRRFSITVEATAKNL